MPELRARAVVVVALPTVTVLADAPVPIFTAPVVPESKVAAEAVVDETVIAALLVTAKAATVKSALT